jgi:hypothetical protein
VLGKPGYGNRLAVGDRHLCLGLARLAQHPQGSGAALRLASASASASAF